MSSIAPVVVWLRNDLRLDDHEPFSRALASGAPVVPVFCIDPRQFGTLPSGVRKTGAFRARFLLESLQDLRAACRSCGGDLIVRMGTPEQLLPALVRDLGASRVLVHAEVAHDETTVEHHVRGLLRELGVSLEACWGHTLYHGDDLPFELTALPDLFTRFRQSVERDGVIRPPMAAPRRISTPPIEAGAIPTLQELGFAPTDIALASHANEDGARVRFRPRGGETAALQRLQHFIWDTDRLRRYKETRNGMLAIDDSSKLSPWLALGCLSPRRVWAEVQRYERERVKNESSYWLVFELLWRDYFRLVTAKSGVALFSLRGLQQLDLPWRMQGEAGVDEDLDRWTQGMTGFPLVDAAMRELSATGFMSNRARQNVASFLTKNLRIDWRVGAEWFESLLVDYDVASNWGNWAYAAGVGNDARGFRFFNLHKQSLEYDPQGDFVRHWVPELGRVPGAAVHRPELLSFSDQQRFGVVLGTDYPAPMVDLFASARANEQLYQRAAKQTRAITERARSAGRSDARRLR